MSAALLDYFRLQRRIFCLCPRCHAIHRLSDLRLFLKVQPKKDWLDSIEEQEAQLEAEESRIEERRQALQERAREAGRRQAAAQVRKVDKVFTPRRLNPDDAKVIFHPLDFLVFEGMKGPGEVRRLLLLDRSRQGREQLALQDSIRNAVAKRKFEWQTMRVAESGEAMTD